MNDNELPKFDLPESFVATDEIPVALLQTYGRFPCKIKAGLFILCTRGTVKAMVNLTQHTIREGDFVTLLPNSFIQIEEVSDDIHLCMAGFSGEFMLQSNYLKWAINSLYDISQHPSLSLPPRIVRLYVQAFDLLKAFYATGHSGTNPEVLASILSLCMQTCVNLYRHYKPRWNDDEGRDKELCRHFFALLNEHFAKEHEVAFYACECHVTVPHFCSAVKRATGHTALTLINRVLVMNAKERLHTTTLTVKEIAFELGFNNPSHFNRFFREHTGMTPLQYRKA